MEHYISVLSFTKLYFFSIFFIEMLFDLLCKEFVMYIIHLGKKRTKRFPLLNAEEKTQLRVHLHLFRDKSMHGLKDV